jgi:voltage-gated potassium channel Kch
LFLVVFGGSIFFFHEVEGWRYLDSAYFTTITMMTVGYGDFAPLTDLGKIGAIFLAFSGILTVFYLFSSVARMFFMRALKDKMREEGKLKHGGIFRVGK